MTIPVAPLPAIARPALDLKAAARALGASGGGAGASRLLSLLCDSKVETEHVLACLRGEPALSARVLKVANSPYYHQSGSVGTVDRAVQLLGLTAIRGVAAAGCLDRSAPPRAGQAFVPERFRLHSLAVACAAQRLSSAAGAGVDGEAFMAGLLHDIGVLLLAKADAAAMAAFDPPKVDAAEAGLRAERLHFGADHATCGGVLVDAWALPAWLHAALTHHHGAGPAAAPTGLAALPALVAVADHLAHLAGFPLWPLCGSAPVPTLVSSLGLADETIADLVASLPDAVQHMAGSA